MLSPVRSLVTSLFAGTMGRCTYWVGAMVLGTEGLPPEEAVRQLVNASWITYVVRAMAVLGLADQLARGPRTVVELAEATGTHAPALSRLLRVLVDLGVCARDEADRVWLTEVGEFFRSDVPGSARASVLAIHALTWSRCGASCRRPCAPANPFSLVSTASASGTTSPPPGGGRALRRRHDRELGEAGSGVAGRPGPVRPRHAG